MSSKHEFKVEFGKYWKRYKAVLEESVPIVLEAFSGSDLEDKVSEFYEPSLPQNGESPISFLLRNASNSYQTESEYHDTQLAVNKIVARIGYYCGKVPLLKKVIRLEEFSAELYLGQDIGTKPMAYVSNQEITNGDGFGNDHIRTTISDFNRRSDFDIDVGFEDEGRNYFLKINANTEDRLNIARRIYQGIKSIFDQTDIQYLETTAGNSVLLKLV